MSNLDITDDEILDLADSSDQLIRSAVEHADVSLLRASMLQLVDDERLGQIVAVEQALGGTDRMALPAVEDPDDQRYVRERAIEWLRNARDGGAVPHANASREEFGQILELALGVPLDDDQKTYWWEEFGVEPSARSVDLSEVPPDRVAGFHVLVIGSGMNGITAGIRLQESGIPYRIIEKNSGVGGTWFENRYPGARVDVASRAYSFSYEPDYVWRHTYATQDELAGYFDHCADKYAIRSNIRFNTEVTSMRWDGDAGVWHVQARTADGDVDIVANAVISAVGLFNRPSLAELPGIDAFEGSIVHTAQWDDSLDLSDKSVAVIGTGSSGVQIVGPLSTTARRLTVFQRGGTWIANIPNYRGEVEATERWLYKNLPFYVNWTRVQELYAIGDARASLLDVDPNWTDPNSVSEQNNELRDQLIKYLMAQIGDRPDLVEQCIPKYPPMAKRLPKDNGWFEALKLDSVRLVSDAIQTVTPHGIRTVDGTEHPIDVMVLATGFHANRYLWPMHIEGRNGLTLEKAWSADGARAYLGMTIPNFPNLFCLYGPNTNGKSGLVSSWGELQVRYAIESFKYLMLHDRKSMNVKADVHDRFNELLDERLRDLIWMDQRQKSYYRNDFNRVATNGAWINQEYWPWTRVPNVEEFEIE